MGNIWLPNFASCQASWQESDISRLAVYKKTGSLCHDGKQTVISRSILTGFSGVPTGQPVSTESCALAWRETEFRLDHLICKSLRLLFFMIARSLATTRMNFQVSMECELKIGKPSYVELQQGAVFVTGGVSVTRWVRLNPARSQAIRTIKRCYSPSKVHRKETQTESRKPSLTPPSLPERINRVRLP